MKLSEAILLIGGGTPKTTISDYWNGDIPWISVKDFNDNSRYVYKTEKSITQLGLTNSSTKMLEKDDIIISARGTVGELAMIPYPMAFNQSCYGIRGKSDIVIQTYLYYLLRDSVNLLKSQTHGSVFDTITRDTFTNIEISLPPIQIQSMIAKTLSAIDDKIENNSKINHHLEQIAQAIFANSFSTSTVTEIGNLSSLIEFKNGKSRPIDFGTVPVYGGNGILSYTSQSNAENVIIIGRVGAYCGSIYLEPENCWVTDNAIYAKSKLTKKEYYDYFLLQKLKLSTRHIGTSQPLLTQGILNTIEVPVPTIDSINSFHGKVTPLFENIHLNLAENARLSELRDTLLPRLMSGELSVRDLSR